MNLKAAGVRAFIASLPCRCTSTIALLLILACTSAHAADEMRRIAFERLPKKNSVLLAIRSDALSVSFNQRHAWNVAEIRFKDRIVGQISGATGTVIHWDVKATGTGHGGEVVEGLTLTLDGRDVPLVENGRVAFKMTDTHTAREVVLTRHSIIGPLRVRARFEFPADAAHYLVTQSYEVMEAITPERFAGYKYTFMHMMPLAFTDWQTFRADGTSRSGQNTPAQEKKPRNTADEINTPFRALACYAPEWRTGIVYAYPREYEGSNHLLHRAGEDHKFRAMLFRETGYAKGETFEFQMKVAPFEAAPDAWNARAQSLASPTQP